MRAAAFAMKSVGCFITACLISACATDQYPLTHSERLKEKYPSLFPWSEDCREREEYVDVAPTSLAVPKRVLNGKADKENVKVDFCFSLDAEGTVIGASIQELGSSHGKLYSYTAKRVLQASTFPPPVRMARATGVATGVAHGFRTTIEYTLVPSPSPVKTQSDYDLMRARQRAEWKAACEVPGDKLDARPTLQSRWALDYGNKEVKKLSKRAAELCFSLDAGGKIIDGSVFRIDGQGHAINEPRYHSILRNWRFDPMRRDGAAVQQHRLRFKYDPSFVVSPAPCTDENKVVLPIREKGKTVDPFMVLKNTSGQVELCMTVDSHGYVVPETIKPLHSNLSAVFDWAAIETVKHWRFTVEDGAAAKTDHVAVVYEYENFSASEPDWEAGEKPDCEVDAIEPIVRVEPVYPYRRSLRAGLEGYVVLQFAVDEEGHVDRETIVVKKAWPSSIFNRASIRAVRKWQYQPKVDGGVAVPRPCVATVLHFVLNG